MKKILLLSVLFINALFAFSQVEDYNGIKVTQSGNNYKAEYSKKTANNGYANEVWSGQIVNGKREGVWKFSGTYSKYLTENSISRTGNVNVTRTYKNGIPHGKYTAVYKIYEQPAAYNYLTGIWSYGEQNNLNESVSGDFLNGNPTNNWHIESNRNHEIIDIHFNEGILDGKLTRILNNVKDEVQYKNGYAIHKKEPVDETWGWELSYDNIDPITISPKDTLNLNEYIHFFDYYAHGMSIIDKYQKFYPEHSSNEKINVYYILADYDKYYKPYGNYPQEALKKYENKYNTKLLNNALKLSIEINDKERRFINNLNKYDKLRYNFYKRLYAQEHLENIWLRDSIYPSYKNDIDNLITLLNSRNISSNELNNILNRIQTKDNNEIYEKSMNDARNELTNLGITPNDTLIWDKYKSIEWKPLIKDIKAKNDSINIANTFELTNEDIDICTAIAYFKVELEWSTQQLRLTQIKDDPSYLTREKIETFAYKHALINNTRDYEIKGNQLCSEKDVLYLIKKYGYQKNYEKILKKIYKNLGFKYNK